MYVCLDIVRSFDHQCSPIFYVFYLRLCIYQSKRGKKSIHNFVIGFFSSKHVKNFMYEREQLFRKGGEKRSFLLCDQLFPVLNLHSKLLQIIIMPYILRNSVTNHL